MPVAAQDIQLAPEHVQELGGIIKKMEAGGEPPEKIKAVVSYYRQQHTTPKQEQPVSQQIPKYERATSDISQYTNVKAPSEKQPTGLHADAPASIIPDSEAIKIRNEDAANRTVKAVNDHLDKTLLKINNNASDKAFKEVSRKHATGDMSDEDYQKAQNAYLSEVMLNKDQRLAEAKDLMNKDPQYQAKVVQKIADDNPKIAKQLKADQYILSAQNRPEKAGTIIKNAQDIESGNKDFNIEHGQLTKNLDFAQSVAAGYNQRNKTLEDYDFYNGATDEDAIKHLDDKINNVDPDKAVDVPGGLGSTIGGQGILMAKGVGAATAASAIGAGAAAPWAAAMATSPEIYKTSYTNSLERNYADILNSNPTISKQEALHQAKDKASFDAKADAAAGIAMTVVGAGIGLKNFKPSELSPSFINVAKNIAHHVAETGVEGAVAGTAAGGAEVLKNIHNGKPAGEGVADAITGQLLFAYGMAGLTHAAKAFISPKARQVIVQNVAKAPEEVVNKTLGDLVSHGKVTPEEANDIHTEIQTQRENDLKIPSNVKSDKARADIQKMLERRDQLEIRLENQSKAFHPETKEKIASLDEKINETAAAGKQHDTGEEVELPFPKTEEKPSVSVVRPEENQQPNIVPLNKENYLNLYHGAEIEKQLPNTLSPAEKQGALDGGSANAAATAITGAIHSANEKPEGGKKLTERKLKDYEASHLEDYAKKNGLWINREFGKPDAEGFEQKVYYNEGGETVTKLNTNINHKSWNDFFHRVAVHNSLFPNTKYTLKGFTEHNGEFAAVLEQPVIHGGSASGEDIHNDLSKSGFVSTTPNNAYYYNKETGVQLSDVHGKNVLKSSSGELHYIDPMIDKFYPEENTSKNKNHAIQESRTGEILQRQPEQTGIAGGERGGMEPSIEGQKAPEESKTTGKEEKIAAINAERQQKINEVTRPDTNFDEVKPRDMVKGATSDEYIQRRDKQADIQDRFERIKKVIECLWP